ncbi:hypothetical protein C9374_008842 [Naegleria lovaniensis]|uniref:mRNA guanylyltransferase n=1 Tax=Naegleria lovaniensis TaxID=51637 RepID=A0AA88KET1_NAELO|nr:uncharacterized protein C9374_008842 [Naegleria lovaniensis]KAG2377757.1 hypothetical protein C9374_008842 [Naegleria lovaniensis]
MESLNPSEFCRASSSFIQCVLSQNEAHEAFGALQEMIDNNTSSAALEREHGSYQLKTILQKNLELNDPNHFPGPMAVQISRTSLEKLRNNEYYITEKSDGIRAMMMMLCSKNFPRWVYDDDHTDQFNLLENCAIECTYHHAKQGAKEDVVLQLTILANTNFLYNRRTNTVQLLNTNTNTRRTLKRLSGWCFSFFFDRNFEFYLCLEEIVFPTKSTISGKVVKMADVKYQDLVILDGEIVYNIQEKRYNYSIYDVISFVKEYIHKETNTAVDKIVSLRKESMTTRYKEITSGVTDPHYYYYQKVLRKPTPKSLKLIRKHFYDKTELMTVLNCIKEDPKTGEYIYKGYNKNDGLIFTPKSGELSAFKPGSNDYLMKWKWPNKLTCDFLVCPVNNSPIVENARNSADNCFYFYFQFKRKLTLFSVCQVKKISESLVARFKGLEANEALIAECGYDLPNYGGWYFLLIREDKNTPNAFKTVANTLENMLENVTVDDLQYYLLPSDSYDSKKYKRILDSREQFLREYEAKVVELKAFAYFKLAHHQGSLSLQYCIADDGVSWNFHCYVGDSKVNLDHVRNSHNQVVETYFNPMDGKYVVTRTVTVAQDELVKVCSGSKLLDKLLLMEKARNLADAHFAKSSPHTSRSSPAHSSSTSSQQQKRSIQETDANGSHALPSRTGQNGEPSMKKVKQ